VQVRRASGRGMEVERVRLRRQVGRGEQLASVSECGRRGEASSPDTRGEGFGYARSGRRSKGDGRFQGQREFRSRVETEGGCVPTHLPASVFVPSMTTLYPSFRNLSPGRQSCTPSGKFGSIID